VIRLSLMSTVVVSPSRSSPLTSKRAIGVSISCWISRFNGRIYSLSRAGYFPRGLSAVNPRRVPARALIVPGLIGWVVIVLVDVFNRLSAREPGQSLTEAAPEVLTGDLLIQIAVFSALISYVAMMLSFIVLRRNEPDLHRPYRTPGGTVTASIALVLALIAMGSAFVYGTKPAITIARRFC
jgi:ethanolamine permease